MEENNLKFRDTFTVEQFKDMMKVNKIVIKRNHKTNKLFFSYGAKTGAVSRKGVPTNPMISEVATPEGEVFYLMHEEGTGGAEVIATF